MNPFKYRPGMYKNKNPGTNEPRKKKLLLSIIILVDFIGTINGPCFFLASLNHVRDGHGLAR